MFGLSHPRITRRIDLSASTTHSPPKDFDPSSGRPNVEKDRLPQPGSSQASTSAAPAVDMDAPHPRDAFGEGSRPTSNLSQLVRLFTSPERPLASGSYDHDRAGPSRPRPYVLSPSPPRPSPMEDGAEEEDEFMGISEPDLQEMEGVGAIGMDLDVDMEMEMEVDELDELQRESARIVGAIDRRASKVNPRRAQLAELANRRKRRIVDSDSEPDPYPDDDPPNLIDLSREDDHPPSDNTNSARSGPRSSRSGGTAAWSDTPESHMPVTPHADDYNDEEDETPIEWPTSPALRGRGGGDDQLARLFSSPPPLPPPPGDLASASTSTSTSKAKGKGKQAQAPTPVVVELLSDDDYVPVALSPPPKSSSSAQKRKRSSPKKVARPRPSTTKAAPTSSGTNGPRKSKSIQDYIDDVADLAGSGSPDRPSRSRSRSDDVPPEVEEEDEYDLDPFPFPFPSSFSGLGFDAPAVGSAATKKSLNDPNRLLLIPDLPEDEQDFYMNHWRRGSNKKYPANDVVSMQELEEMADKSDARRANGVAAGRGRGAWGKRGAFARRGVGRGRGRGRARGRAR